MNNEEVKCPRCGNEFPIADVFAQIRKETVASLEAKNEQTITKLQDKVAEQRARAKKAETTEASLEAKHKAELKEAVEKARKKNSRRGGGKGQGGGACFE